MWNISDTHPRSNALSTCLIFFHAWARSHLLTETLMCGEYTVYTSEYPENTSHPVFDQVSTLNYITEAFTQLTSHPLNFRLCQVKPNATHVNLHGKLAHAEGQPPLWSVCTVLSGHWPCPVSRLSENGSGMWLISLVCLACVLRCLEFGERGDYGATGSLLQGNPTGHRDTPRDSCVHRAQKFMDRGTH